MCQQADGNEGQVYISHISWDFITKNVETQRFYGNNLVASGNRLWYNNQVRYKDRQVSGMTYCDLHTHSVYSDGTYTPAQLVEGAVCAGLSAIALCDHNNVSGLPHFLAAAEGQSIEAVGGVELSTDYGATELHILGLYIEPQYFDEINAMMLDYKHRKEESNIRLVEALRADGYAVDYDAIRSRTPDGQVNRALIAAALTEKGYTTSIKEAFSRLLSEKNGYYVPPSRISSFDAIAYLRSIGAVTVLAHPLLNLTEEELEIFLPQAKAAGLDGMETLYSTYDEHERAVAAGLAEKYGLLHSGGSDFHGENKPDIRLGVGRGDLAVPSELLDAIKILKNQRRTF